MIHREFKWDNEAFLEARYGNKCFYGEHDDGGQSSAGLDGGGNEGGNGGWGSDVTGGFGGTLGSGGLSNPNFGMGPSNSEGSYGPAGNPDVGDGGAAAACEARGGVWDSSNGTCSVPNTPNPNPGSGGGGGGEEHGGEEEFENVADQNFAELLRRQWADYLERWGPVEEEMSDLLTDDDFGEDVVRRARQAGLAMDNAAQAERMMDRYGVDIQGRQAESLNRGYQRDRQALGVGLANKTRAGMVDLKDALQKDMIGIGHGIGASATAGLGQAAQMETNRAAAIAQMKQAQSFFNQSQALQQQQYQMQYQYAQKSQRSGIFGLIGTALGGVVGGMVGAPTIGATIGGGIGSMIG